MLEKEIQHSSRGVYPPSFCRWRLVVAVMIITEISVILIGLGKPGLPGWAWLGSASMYAQWMAFFVVSGLCITSGWTNRMSVRGAWIGSWLIGMVLAGLFSFAALQSGTVSALAPDNQPVAHFVLKNAFAVGLVSMAFFRYLMIRAQWRAEMVAQAEARVQALQARIQPHFLFNSLNTIASLIPEEPENAEAATLDLADIFRGSMRRADRPISLADELGLARQYLDMEKRRLGARMELDWRVSDLPAGASVLPLMLQPLLENAVAHGVQSRPEGGKVSVYGRSEGDQVVVTIANPVSETGLKIRGNGMALENIRERLQFAFGSRASLVTYEDADCFYAILSVPYVEYTDR